MGSAHSPPRGKLCRAPGRPPDTVPAIANGPKVATQTTSRPTRLKRASADSAPPRRLTHVTPPAQAA
eukprot:1871495-Pyramimonas_sp.AAC.1